jgi:mRNA interferase HigB
MEKHDGYKKIDMHLRVFLKENYVIFNIKGNSYRLVVKVAYNSQTVLVKWIGTHAEYDKKTFP